MTNWKQHWNEGNTPWDAGGSPPILKELADDLPKGRALVPGCGTGYDILTLSAIDRIVTGVDLSEVAKTHFETIREAAAVPEDQANYRVGDFFSMDLGSYDLIWDYTFLCALPPQMRKQWGARMSELVSVGGTLATLVFPVFDADDDYKGPPWPMSVELVAGILEGTFVQTSCFQVNESHPKREGKEWLVLWERKLAS